MPSRFRRPAPRLEMILAGVVALTAIAAACTSPGATPAASPSEAMMEHSAAPSEAMMEHSPAPSASDAMMEHSPSPS